MSGESGEGFPKSESINSGEEDFSGNDEIEVEEAIADENVEDDEGEPYANENKDMHEADSEVVSIDEEGKSLIDLLSVDQETEHLVPICAEIFEKADEIVVLVDSVINQFKGAELISSIAQENIVGQVQEFMTAAHEIRKDGSSTISVFGRISTFSSIEEITDRLFKILEEFNSITEIQVESSSDFQDRLLPVVDKYLFDFHERLDDSAVNLKILVLEQDEKIPSWLTEERVKGLGIDISKDEDDSKSNLRENLHSSGIINSTDGGVFYGGGDNGFEEDLTSFGVLSDVGVEHILEPGSDLPDVVVVEVGGKDGFTRNHKALQQLFIDYWGHLKIDERPLVILYSEGHEPTLFEKSSYEGFMFCSNVDQLSETVKVLKGLVESRNVGYVERQKIIQKMQESQYDASFDLREWEQITADTYQSLKHTLGTLSDRIRMSEEEKDQFLRGSMAKWLSSDRAIDDIEKLRMEMDYRMMYGSTKTLLDCGTGDGRIGGALARIGYNVIGIDISQEQLNRGKKRFEDEGKGLRGESEDSGLSYNSILRLRDEGLIKDEDIVKNDQEARKKYITLKSDFLDMMYEVHQAMLNWEVLYPEIDKYDFFNVNPFDEYAFYDERDYFADVGFDAVTFNWHTWNEISDLAQQKDVLRQIFRMLSPGGQLIIEIPNRSVDPYASLLADYYEQHPDEPYGILRERYDSDEGEDQEFSPRYFPDRNELLMLLQLMGFEFTQDKIHSYLISNRDEETGQDVLSAHEQFIVANKPWH